jgi:hypothetical protein
MGNPIEVGTEDMVYGFPDGPWILICALDSSSMLTKGAATTIPTKYLQSQLCILPRKPQQMQVTLILIEK